MSIAAIPTVAQVVDQLDLDPAEARKALELRPDLVGQELAWPIRLLTGFGAWLAGMFFLSAFACFDLLTEPEPRAFIGVLLLGSAVALRWAATKVPNDFLIQLALAFVVAGQALVVTSVGEWTDSATTAVFFEVLLALGLLVVFPDAVQRFASTVVACLGTAWLLADLGVPHTVDLMAMGLGAGTAAVWLLAPQLSHGPLQPWVRPVGMGLATSLFGVLQTSVWPVSEYTPSAFTWVAMVVLLVGVTAWLLRENRADFSEAGSWVALLAAVAIASIAWRAPGVAAAGMAMLLAVHRRDAVLLGLATVALVSFGSAFYYWLDVSLMAKSAVLVSTGALLLGLRLAALHLLPEEAA